MTKVYTDFKEEIKEVLKASAEEEKKLKQALIDLQDETTQKLRDIEAKCLEVNGNHVDDGGMFFASCKYCSYSEWW